MDDLQNRRYLQDMFDNHGGVEKYESQLLRDFIIKDGFDMTGWELVEIPAEGQFCFYNEATNRCFDLSIIEGSVTAQYMDTKKKHIHEMFDAESIEDAVHRYNWPEAEIVPL